MEAQARICPTCFDDHSESRECTPGDLKWRIQDLEGKLAEVTKKYDDLLLTISEEKLLEATDKLTKERDSLKLWQTKAREFIRAVRDDAQKTVDIIDRARAFQESDK